MESWRIVFRNGFAPLMSDAGLQALLAACETDDPALRQGETTSPPPLMCVRDWPCEAADAIGYAGWKGEGLATVGEVSQYFARMCFEADGRLGEVAGCRWFLNWWDDTPREEVLAEVAGECSRELARRRDLEPAAVEYVVHGGEG